MLVCGCVRESSHRQPSLSSRPPPLLDPHSPQATGGTGAGQLNAEHEPNVGIGSPNAGAIACPMWRLSTRRQRGLERFTPANEVPPPPPMAWTVNRRKHRHSGRGGVQVYGFRAIRFIGFPEIAIDFGLLRSGLLRSAESQDLCCCHIFGDLVTGKVPRPRCRGKARAIAPSPRHFRGWLNSGGG